jgi:uncharacterized protein DUF4382
MRRIMLRWALYGAVLTGLAASLAACGGGGSGESSASTSSSTSNTQSMGSVPISISDASSDDWATVAVRVLSIALVPQGGGSAVTVWTAPSPAPYVNLEELDQLSEILGNVSVPVGTYGSAVLTISANPGDVLLTSAPDPEPGFPVAGGTSIPSDQIRIQHAQGSSGSLTVAVTVNLVSPLSVTTGQNSALDLEFDLSHPAFIVGHTPPAADGATMWAINFSGPVRHHPIRDLTRLVLRRTYGTVTGVTSGGLLSISKDFAALPLTSPETAIGSEQSLNIAADSTNGTIVYDLDNPGAPGTVVTSFAAGTVPTNDYVRIAARFQEDGTLTAVRVYYSSSFNTVWLNPEGHVLGADASTNTIWVTNELGEKVAVSVTSSTNVYFHSGSTSIGDATTLLANQQIVRGFKVDVAASNSLSVPLVAQSIDIQTAAFGGAISNASATLPAPNGGLTYTAEFRTSSDDYSVNLGFLSDTANDNFDPQGNAITGFDWWDFTFPTTSSTNLTNFLASVEGQVNFGGSVGALVTYGVSAADWGDGGTVNTSNWYLRDAVLLPAPVPLGTVSIAYTGGSTFAMTALGGSQAATVDVSTTPGSATLVYQLNRSNGTVTLTQVDITTGTGLAALEGALIVGAPVKVYGIPQADGSLGAYVLIYYTGTMPAS